MTGLAHIKRVLIPGSLFSDGHALLRDIGASAVEGLVLWAGRSEGDVFAVHTVIRPAQRSARGERGLFVAVDGPELHRLGVWLYNERMQLIAQVHTHPTDAYHSEMDDAIPIVTTVGGISLVVPDFATGPAVLETYACYRLDAAGTWRELSNATAGALITITD